MFRSFEDLEVWKRSCNLAVRIYEVLNGCRELALRDQMQRAAVSIASNIAEGHERSSLDFARFLRIALGSVAELRTQVYIAARIGLLDKTTMTELVKETREIACMLSALVKCFKKRTATSASKTLKTEN